MLPVIASSLISGAFNTAQQSQMLQQQKQENELSFKRNMQLAQQQNAMNIAQWNRENEYNLPINQIKRLKEAGLSPAMLYKNGTSGLTAATSPSMSAGEPYQPVDMTMSGNRQTIGDVIQNTINNSLQSAQVDLLKAQADKTRSETYGINIENNVKEKLLFSQTQAEIEKTLADAGVSRANIPLIAQNVEKFKKECDVFDATIKEKFANVQQMSFENFMNALRYGLEKVTTQANIAKIASETRLNVAKVYEIAELLPLVMSGHITEIMSNLQDTETARYERFLIFEKICTEIATRANIDADTSNKEANTEATRIGNVKSGDQAKRYENLYEWQKDVLFVIDELFGSPGFTNLTKMLESATDAKK